MGSYQLQQLQTSMHQTSFQTLAICYSYHYNYRKDMYFYISTLYFHDIFAHIFLWLFYIYIIILMIFLPFISMIFLHLYSYNIFYFYSDDILPYIQFPSYLFYFDIFTLILTMILNFLPDSSNTVLPYIAKTILYLYLHHIFAPIFLWYFLLIF